jgi:hypothetical protein
MGGRAGAAAEAALIVVCRSEGMLDPGLANLLKALIVSGSSTYPIKILSHQSVAGIRKRHKINLDVSAVANGGSHSEAELVGRCSASAIWNQVTHITDNDVGPRGETS